MEEEEEEGVRRVSIGGRGEGTKRRGEESKGSKLGESANCCPQRDDVVYWYSIQ
jgi:hypothetical protein